MNPQLRSLNGVYLCRRRTGKYILAQAGCHIGPMRLEGAPTRFPPATSVTRLHFVARPGVLTENIIFRQRAVVLTAAQDHWRFTSALKNLDKFYPPLSQRESQRVSRPKHGSGNSQSQRKASQTKEQARGTGTKDSQPPVSYPQGHSQRIPSTSR